MIWVLSNCTGFGFHSASKCTGRGFHSASKFTGFEFLDLGSTLGSTLVMGLACQLVSLLCQQLFRHA